MNLCARHYTSAIGTRWSYTFNEGQLRIEDVPTRRQFLQTLCDQVDQQAALPTTPTDGSNDAQTKKSTPGAVSHGSAWDSSSPTGCISLVCSSTLGSEDRDALGRVAYAEAGNQGTEGLTAVLYVVLNRLASGRFGSSVGAVIEASGQFEPVDRAGRRWRNLPTLSASNVAIVATIIDLIQQGRLPDPTHGATFFQNPQIVASRAAGGQVPISLTNFNNQTPIAVIRDHAFFRQISPDSLPCKAGSPAGQFVYPPGVTPPFRIERSDAGTPGQPCAVIYRIISITKKTAETTSVGTDLPR